jgi:hypothetical protein
VVLVGNEDQLSTIILPVLEDFHTVIIKKLKKACILLRHIHYSSTGIPQHSSSNIWEALPEIIRQFSPIDHFPSPTS